MQFAESRHLLEKDLIFKYKMVEQMPPIGLFLCCAGASRMNNAHKVKWKMSHICPCNMMHKTEQVSIHGPVTGTKICHSNKDFSS